MLFDAQAALAEILSDRPSPAIPANPAIQSGQIAEIAEIAAPPISSADCSEPVRSPDRSSHPNVLALPEVFPHGQCSVTGRPRTWTGRIVNLAEWRELSDWDRNGSTGKVWNGLTQKWEKSSDAK